MGAWEEPCPHLCSEPPVSQSGKGPEGKRPPMFQAPSEVLCTLPHLILTDTLHNKPEATEQKLEA